MNIFTDNQLRKAEQILQSPLSKLSDLTSSDIRNLAVVWCYYSGKIEGNTYTYVETEALLKDGITSEKRYEDAKMLKNLHNLFVSEMEYIHKGKNTEIIDERTVNIGHVNTRNTCLTCTFHHLWQVIGKFFQKKMGMSIY